MYVGKLDCVCVCVCNVMYVQMYVREHILEQLYNKVSMHTCLRIRGFMKRCLM